MTQPLTGRKPRIGTNEAAPDGPYCSGRSARALAYPRLVSDGGDDFGRV